MEGRTKATHFGNNISNIINNNRSHKNNNSKSRCDILSKYCVSSVQFTLVTRSYPTLWPHESQHPRPPCPSPTPGVHLRLMSIKSVMLSSHLILGRLLLLLPPIPPSIRVFSSESTLRMRWQRTGASALASFLPKKSQGYLLQNGLVGSPCSPRSSQESSPTPQFKSINSSALSLLHSPTLTSIHDYWKNHSLD